MMAGIPPGTRTEPQIYTPVYRSLVMIRRRDSGWNFFPREVRTPWSFSVRQIRAAEKPERYRSKMWRTVAASSGWMAYRPSDPRV